MNKATHQWLRDALLNREESILLAARCAGRAVSDAFAELGTQNITAAQFMLDMVHYTAVRNMKLVHRHAESEIEQRFLGTLAIRFAMELPFGFYMTAAATDVNALIEEYKTNTSPYDVQRARILEGSDDKSDAAFVRECKKRFVGGEFDRTALDTYVTNTWIRAHFDLGSIIHATPQAAMPKIFVMGKSIRPDLLLWIPNRDDFRVVCECDGYKWHSSEEAKERDQKRDARLKVENINVYRFGGKGLYHDALAVGNGFFRQLLTLIGEMNPPLPEIEKHLDVAQEKELLDACLDAMDYRHFITDDDWGFPEDAPKTTDSESSDGCKPQQ